MKAVILAAGLGTRLRPITNEVPKCMVEVNGIKIIDRQITNLLHNGIDDICVVSGYKSEILSAHLQQDFPQITVIENSRYSQTNNMYSLFLAKDFIEGEDFLLMNADVYFDGNIITGLLRESKSAVACDKSQYLEESMKITLDTERRINHISKKIRREESFAVSIDVYKISSADSKTLLSEIEDTVISRKDENSWTEVALDKIFCKADFKPYIIGGRWFEIDNHDDLATARQIFQGDCL